MVASIKPHRDELGLADGLMLIGGQWTQGTTETTWSHRHPATGEQVASFPIASATDVDNAVRAARHAATGSPAWAARAAAPPSSPTPSSRPCCSRSPTK